METKDEHLEIVKKKSEKSRKIFEIQMLGTGMFSDFDTILEEKRLKKLKEKKNET